MILNEKYIPYSKLAIYENDSGLFNDSFINLNYLFISEFKGYVRENIIILLVQVPLKKLVQILSVSLEIKGNTYTKKLNAIFEVGN